MKIEKQLQEDHQIKLTVEVEPEVFESAKQRAARTLAKKVKIPGFRPGKAPYAVIERTVGEGAILEEAMEIVVQDVYPKAIEEAEIKPYGPGSLENIVSNDPPVFAFVIPLEAEVDLGDYRSVSFPYEPKGVEEADIEGVFENLRERQAIIEPVDRPAQAGDLVTVKMNARRLNPDEGQPETLIQDRSMPVIVKAEKENQDENEPAEWPFPGFSAHLVGMSVGDEKTVAYTFPEDYEYSSLSGVEGEYTFSVEEVKERALPELNDEFATTVGDYENLEALRADIRTHLEQQAEQEYNETYDDQVLQASVELATIKYPPQMLEQELENVIHNLGHRLEQQNLEMDLYLKTRNMDMDALREELRPTAESRLKRSLILMELAKQENIQLKPEELQEEAIRTLSSISQTLSKNEARRFSNQEVFNNLVNNIAADMMVQKAMARLRSISSGREETEETATTASVAAETAPVEAIEEGSAPEAAAEAPVESVDETTASVEEIPAEAEQPSKSTSPASE